ncbi:SDR family NAD(P)-dependent oxidoreductase [Dietzia cinnamea]|uniref:SDR family NAD(P)-dependent oxidoreductase n=1 Tax=Dietzia cinnamea TaxID=321318 RepID=UPI00223AE8AA|nr:SDR family NAD(P)-dependent oxidoreductase [Dietzia cinnamea]MCT1639114.1 SDR family NAD(P)-dependent oxidoreductase [Dietzia cinnamea]MCT1883867.1 SDR family NAD(P)-dependent oxidoreductase [Dietzia cinnamea]MCT2119987.1 SDR family NAD(P)-dependent oxidoreductase [Dietzia cinnamea]MCT2139790.1 SDR family NAD(P)-dependent oxidoreductase [Dietzia cinnamea]MCT2144451.1 SDR family NAD(P)-dependent oxidoreductase [Dietzia cinnamea]
MTRFLPRRSAGLSGRPASDGPGRRVLITGAASGLGLALSREYLALGDEVILTDVHADPPPAVQGLPGRWTYRRLDVTSDADWASAAEDIDSLDILVNNAGIAVGGSLETTSMESWQRIVDINLLGVVRGCRALAPKLGRGGRLVITASAAGLVHAPKMGAYNATKAAAVALGETLDAELRPRGVSTSVICPQFFRSGLAESLSGDDPKADEMARKLLTRTHLTSEIIARRSVRGIEARRVVITPDALATFFWYSKRFSRVPFLASTRLIGRAVARQG